MEDTQESFEQQFVNKHNKEEYGLVYNQFGALIKKKKWDELEKIVKYDALKFDIMVDLLSTNQHCKKACDLIKKYKKNGNGYPKLIDRLIKKAVRYLQKSSGWEQSEIRLMNRPEFLAVLAEDLFFENQKYEAIYIVNKYNQISKITKTELADYFSQNQQNATSNPIKLRNKYLATDSFGPKEKDIEENCENVYIEFSDFGLSEEDIIIIDNYDTWKQYEPVLLQARVIGLDTESIPMYVQFERDTTALQQVSTDEKVFLFDFVSENWSHEIFTEFCEKIIADNDKLKLGLALKKDFENLKKEYGSDMSGIFRNYLDIGETYKSLFMDGKSSLDHIVWELLGKKLSKFEQCSCWSSRPLRKSQMHYAAMDAFVLNRLYKRFVDMENGVYDEIMFTDNFGF